MIRRAWEEGSAAAAPLHGLLGRLRKSGHAGACAWAAAQVQAGAGELSEQDKKAVIRKEIAAAVQQRSKWEQIAGFVLLKVRFLPTCFAFQPDAWSRMPASTLHHS